MEDLGLDGIVLMSNYETAYLGCRQFESLFAEIAARRIPVFIHPNMAPHDFPLDYPPWVFEFVANTTRAVINLIYSGTLDRYPDIPIILAHCGGAAPILPFRLEVGQRA